MASSENGKLHFSWSIVASTMVLLIAIVGGFWQLADPRADIKDIKSQYLSLREHEEFVRRFQADVSRVEKVNTEQSRNMATKSELAAQLHANEMVNATLMKRIDAMQATIDMLIQRSMVQPPPNVSRQP